MIPIISLVIPAFNEAQRITPTVLAFDAALRTRGLPYEILVVDDGSKDATLAVCRALKAQLPQLSCIPGGVNRGKGYAVRIGMLAACGAIRVMVDADGSTPPSCLEVLLAPLMDGTADVAVGSRYVEGAQVARAQPWWRRM